VINSTELSVPSEFVISHQRSVQSDGEDVILKRCYVRSDDRNIQLGGEHFSTLHTPDGKLKGFVNMTYDMVGKPLLSKDESEQIAREFLQQHAPDLLEPPRVLRRLFG